MAFKTPKIVSLLLFTTVAISACDQQAPLPDVGDSLRDITKLTLKVKVSGGFKGNGTWPDGIEPLPWPFPDVLRDDIISLTNQGLAAGWGSTEEAHAACYDACSEVEQEWNGRTFAEGDYAFGEVDFYEGEEGELRYEVDIEYDVALGCECGYAPEG